MDKVKQPTIAAAMIVKGTADEAPYLAKALSSIYTHADAIYVDINAPAGQTVDEAVIEVCKQYDADYKLTEWSNNFVSARNDVFARVPKTYDWLLWLDADDTIDEPDKLKPIVAIASKATQGIYALYDYAHDEFGNVTVAHWVCRLVRNNGSFAWKSSFDDAEVSVHETLNPTRELLKTRTEDFKVVHHADAQRTVDSLHRNIELLEGMYKRYAETGNPDPRILFYLGTHYYDAGRFNNAKQCLQDYMQLSGWNEERSECLVYLGMIYNLESKPDQAKHAYLLAIGEFTNNPRPYIELGSLEFFQGRYSQSADWLNIAINMPVPKSTTIQRPMENTFRAYMLLAQAYVNIGWDKLEEAKKYITKALTMRPLDPDGQQARDMIDELISTRDDTRAAVRLVRNFEKNEQGSKIVPLLDALPDSLQDNPLILNARFNHTKPTKWPTRSIAIYCGPSSLGIWGPWSLTTDGISGSEEAVAQLGKELVTLGWEVTVFATPGDRAGEYDGVLWKQYWELNPHDVFDVFIGWRAPWVFDNRFKARKTYLWLHDVIEQAEFTKERLSHIDKVIVLSDYHKSLYADAIPEDKLFVSGNGIDPTQFEKYEGAKRDPYRCIYTSAHERGLKILYEIWPEVKKAVPEAKLDAYYGWDGYDTINRDNPERMGWKSDLVKQEKALRSSGVIDHGKINHDQIAEAMSQSGVFAYPSVFPEVYCISLIKAQAAGAYPVTSDYAVLDDYNRAGTKVPLDLKQYDKFKTAYTKALIKQLQTKLAVGEDMQKKIRDDFSWKRTAQGWNDEMRGGVALR